METPPESEGGISRGESKSPKGGISRNQNESFYKILDKRTTRHSLLLLLRVKQQDVRPMPVGTHSEHCVSQQILWWTELTQDLLLNM